METRFETKPEENRQHLGDMLTSYLGFTQSLISWTPLITLLYLITCPTAQSRLETKEDRSLQVQDLHSSPTALIFQSQRLGSSPPHSNHSNRLQTEWQLPSRLTKKHTKPAWEERAIRITVNFKKRTSCLARV